MKQYNGHKSWNYWNVSLWINNDEGLYNFARHCVRCSLHKKGAADMMLRELREQGVTKTPDGARYTLAAIREAIKEM